MRTLAAEILCLQSMRFKIGQAQRDGDDIPFLPPSTATPPDVVASLKELQELNCALIFPDNSRMMIGKLFDTIQELIARKQFSRNFEKKVDVEIQFVTVSN